MIASALLTGSLILLQQAAPASPAQQTPDQFDQQVVLEALRRHQPGQALTGILVPLGLFALILAIVWLGTRQRQARIQARSEFQRHLLDKFASGREFTEFLSSSGGQRFLDQLWSAGPGVREKTLSSIRIGVVLAVFGLGLLGLSFAKRGLVVPAVLVLALGSGFLLATAISYRITQRWERKEGAGPGQSQLSS